MSSTHQPVPKTPCGLPTATGGWQCVGSPWVIHWPEMAHDAVADFMWLCLGKFPIVQGWNCTKTLILYTATGKFSADSSMRGDCT